MTPIMPTRSTPRPTTPLPESPPRVRVALAGCRILDANAAFADLVGGATSHLIGTPLTALLAPRERAAIAARLDALVHRFDDRIAAVALDAHGGERVWCAIEADYAPDVDEAFTLSFAPLRRARPDAGDGLPVADAAPPARGEGEAPLVDHGDGEGPKGLDDPRRPASHDEPRRPEPLVGPDAPEAPPLPVAAVPDDAVIRVLDHLGQAALLVDDQWRVRAANAAAAELVGGAPEGLVGQPLTALFVLTGPARAALKAGMLVGEAHPVRAGIDGGSRVVTVRWIPAGDGGGYVVAEEALSPDATTGRLMAAAFHAELISHDAYNQLAGLRAALRQLRRRLPAGSTDAQRAFEDVLSAFADVKDTIALANDLTLDAAKHCEPLDAARHVRNAVARHLGAADEGGVRVVDAFADGLVIRAPGNWIKRIADNLVDNAIRHMPVGGTLHVSVRREDRDRPGVHIEVADTGPGIPEAERERVFEKGFSRRPGGRGVGLYIVRHFTVGLGGQVHCAERPGGGAAFHVWLPLAADADTLDDPTEVTHG